MLSTSAGPGSPAILVAFVASRESGLAALAGSIATASVLPDAVAGQEGSGPGLPR
jgi:hypothetical protein